MKLLILTGMSGSGKTAAFKMLEDIGYYCVDNLPVPLLKSFADLPDINGDSSKKVAVGIDIRSGEALGGLGDILDELEAEGRKPKILFMDAEDEVIVKRYKETRRNHPLSGQDRIQQGLDKERQEIRFLKDRADYIIDTSHLLTRELNEEIKRIFVEDEDYKSMMITILSFGFKYGIPEDSDLVFDVRFLPNPYYVSELKRKTGNDVEVREYVMNSPESKEFVEKLNDMVTFLVGNYIREGKNQLVISVGCTGGKHRSVTIANELYATLKKGRGYGLKLEHRDIDKDVKRGK